MVNNNSYERDICEDCRSAEEKRLDGSGQLLIQNLVPEALARGLRV